MAELPERPAASAGLLSSLQALGSTLLAMGQTRLALLATELEEETQRLLKVMAWGAVMLLLGSMACLFLALTITVVFWDTHRLLALGTVTLLFGAGAAWAGWRLREAGRQPEGGMLAASLAELEADVAALAEAARFGRSGHKAAGADPGEPLGRTGGPV